MVCETVFGATLGKLICGLRVVKKDCSLCNLWQIFLRGIFRLIDGFFFGLPAGLFMSSHRNQRIGDVIAGSYVVSTRDYQIQNKRTGIYFLLAILVSMLLLFMNMVIQLIIIY